MTFSSNFSDNNEIRYIWREVGGHAVVDLGRREFGFDPVPRLVLDCFGKRATLGYAPPGFIDVLKGSLGAGRSD